jgi:hypothetical protein
MLPFEEPRAVLGRHLDSARSDEMSLPDDELHPARPKLVEVHRAHRAYN